MCKDAMQMFRYLVLQFVGFGLGASYDLGGIILMDKGLGWIGKIILRCSGCQSARDTPTMKFGGKMSAQGLVLLVAWGEYGPGC